MAAFSCKYGKRPVFLFSSIMGLIGTALGCVASDYHTLKTARIISGFATAAYESIVIAVIADLHFVHERGFRVAFVNYVWGGVANLFVLFHLSNSDDSAQIISGPITLNLGWQYLFKIMIAFCGLQLILMFLFCEETQYNRPKIYALDTTADTDYDKLGEIEVKASQALTEDTTGTARPIARKTFYQRLALYTGTYSRNNV